MDDPTVQPSLGAGLSRGKHMMDQLKDVFWNESSNYISG